MARQPSLTPSMYVELKNQGLNDSEIARAVGVSRQRVSVIKGLAHYPETAREKAMKFVFWQGGVETNKSDIDRYLRNHLEFQATDGKGMSSRELKRLDAWYKRLLDDNLVVVYDPGIPASPGNRGGLFEYRDRKDSDNDLVIRGRFDDPDYRMWQFPGRLPSDLGIL